MTEDSALTLNTAYENGDQIDIEKVKGLPEKSELAKILLTTPKQRPELFVGMRAYEWRLFELSEIPFAGLLNKPVHGIRKFKCNAIKKNRIHIAHQQLRNVP